MKRLVLYFSLTIVCISCGVAKKGLSVLSREEGRITFAVDDVTVSDNHLVAFKGTEIASELRSNESYEGNTVIACSFSDDEISRVGDDVLFQMLLKAWCQHRPVVFTPDAIWMVICQGFSHYVNEHPEEFRQSMVSHEGRKTIRLESGNLLSEEADWEGLIGRFASEIDKYTLNGLATTLVADFSTTGVNERIASEITLMDVVKPFFKYEAFYAVCGIPSITLTGTPDDWRKVLEKTKALETFGLGWWTLELEPILREFVEASEGRPDAVFWRSIVKTVPVDRVQGPTCGGGRVKQTRFDGWFLKFFPFDNEGRTPPSVTITKTMLPETVCVPMQYDLVGPDGKVLSSTNLEIVAGIVGVVQDTSTLALTPHIGWFVRLSKEQ